MFPDLPSKSKHLITDKNCKAENIGCVISWNKHCTQRLIRWYQFILMGNAWTLPNAPHSYALQTRWGSFPQPLPPPPHSVIHIPTLTFMEPLDRGEPSTSSQRGDAGGVERVLIRAGGRKWSGWVREWVVEVKVAQHCAKGKVSNQTSQLLFRP